MNSIADDLWEATCPLPLGPFRIDHRMTVARLASGGLWVHSPIPLTGELRSELEVLGKVEFLVAPSVYHDMYWPEWFAAYPNACFCAVPGLQRVLPDLPFTVKLVAEPHAGWRDEIDQVPIAGMPAVNETVFLHRASGTVIAADLVFNYSPGALGFMTRQLLRTMGTHSGMAMSRLFRFGIKDQAATCASIERILSWEFDRLVVGHGSVLEQDAHESLARACHVLGK